MDFFKVHYIPVGNWPDKTELKTGDYFRIVEVIQKENEIIIRIAYVNGF